MAAARRRKSRRGQREPAPAWLWLLTGVLIGLGLATWALLKGYIPQPEAAPEPTPAAQTASEAPLLDSNETGSIEEEDRSERYDFFTLLPEMEVAVPEESLRQEASKQASQPAASETSPAAPAQAAATQQPYVLQIGSFRTAEDADRRRAELALQGVSSSIQTVTVNGDTWHRVRSGPYTDAREVENMQRQLREAGIESRVFRQQ